MTDELRRFKGGNTHPVDRLGEIRALIKEAKEIEEALKAEVGALMGERDSLGGDAFIARQRISERKGGLDEKKLAARFGLPAVEECRKPAGVVVTLEVRARVEEEA